jgi:signal transduction histidine kinase
MEAIPRILIADDVAVNRVLLRKLIEGEGWIAEEVADGSECLERCLLGSPPTIILLDIMMPRMDGIEALTKLRARFTRQELPIIMVTTQSEDVGLSAALRAGANDYVSKPFNREVFLARLRNQLELRECSRELQRLQHGVKLEMVSTFALGVAHNFNNCFGSILGAAELLGRGVEGDAKLERYVDVVRRAVEGGVVLTRKLAALVKRAPHEGRLTRERLVQFLEEFSLSQRAQAGGRIEFPLMLGELPPSLEVGETGLEDLLLAVVRNAVEAIPHTGEVRIGARHAPGEKFLMLSVEDTGHGMDAEVLQRAFEPFFSTKNLDRVNGVSIQGNGLGLWTVYHTLHLLGGEIRIESQKGKGTLVHMLVPVAPSAISPQVAPTQGAGDSESEQRYRGDTPLC